MTPTARLQIDAVLTDNAQKLVHAFCGGAWDSLHSLWTIDRGSVLVEAERRGWECFVSSSGGGAREGFQVVAARDAFNSFYSERGTPQMGSARKFDTLEAAVRDMLTRRMDAMGIRRT